MTNLLRASLVVAACLSLGSPIGAQQSAPASRVTATDGRVDLSDPAGDVARIVYLVSVGNGPEKEVTYPGFDIVKLSVVSDGKALTFAATLTAPPAQAAHEVIEFYIDADNNTKTGVTHPDAPKLLTGLEYYGTLEACLEHELFGTMCAGTEEKVSGRSAIVTLEKYGKEWMFTDALIDFPASGKVKAPRKTPITGPVVQASVDYASLGVKPGQTIRLIAREHSTAKIKNVAQGFFPEIVLTLK